MKKIMLEMTPELHKDFKRQCLENGQTFKEALTELIEYYILNPPLRKKE